MIFPIEHKTKSGKLIQIRPPKQGDALSLLTFINTLSKEKTFITMQGEQLKLKDEQQYVKSMLKKIKHHEVVQLLALEYNQVIANTSIELGIRVNHHVGTFAIAISDGYRSEGLGSTLIKLLMNFAQENLPALKIIELKVFANNSKAQHIYAKFGFKEYGRLPKGVLFRDAYIDEIMMYKEI